MFDSDMVSSRRFCVTARGFRRVKREYIFAFEAQDKSDVECLEHLLETLLQLNYWSISEMIVLYNLSSLIANLV